MTTVGILGGGQLGAMLAPALQDLGADVHVFDPDPTAPALRRAARAISAPWRDTARLQELFDACDVVTYEFENVETEGLARVSGIEKLLPSLDVLRTTQDRALAYAWMDLASERGYAGFMGLRERYWEQLTEDERARAVEEGQAVYARFGDEAAQPRLATVLRREKRRSTGSRTGFTGNLQIHIPGPGGFIPIDGSKFYDDRYWDPKQYQAWHDEIWMKPRIGRVSVGSVEQVSGTPPPASRIPATVPQQDAQEPETPEADDTDLGTRKDG